jgi:hypothetical protein
MHVKETNRQAVLILRGYDPCMTEPKCDDALVHEFDHDLTRLGQKNPQVVANMASYAICSEFDFGDS